MDVTESIKQGPLQATGAAFALKGGVYLFMAFGSGFGQSASLQTLAPDGQNWVTVPSMTGDVTGDASLANNGTCLVQCAPGQHRFFLVGNFSNLYCAVTSVPS